VFDAALAIHGFAPGGEADVETTYGARTYIAAPRYVRLTANVEPRDAPFYCDVHLGEGATTWPEADWNKIALWQLIDRVAPGGREGGAGRYPLAGPSDLVPQFERMLADLLRYGAGFLGGDPRDFRRVRAALARARAPYTMYRPDERGRYIAQVDPASAALRERFSCEG
jgi:hypothetical protein